MHPARQCRVRLCHGGRAGGVSPSVRGQRGAGVPGLEQQVRETRTPRHPGTAMARLRIRAQRGEQPVHAVRALGGLAAGGGDGPATKVDWARVVRQLVDVDYPDKDRIVLVMDNLNTHRLSSLYQAFEPAEARRIAEKLEIHYTPKHGSLTWPR